MRKTEQFQRIRLNGLSKLEIPESKALIEKGDLQLSKIAMPVDDSSEPVRLSHAYFAHADSCLWFAVGGENAGEMISISWNAVAKRVAGF